MNKEPTNAQKATEKAIAFFGGETAMAEALGITQPTVNRWKTGRLKPGRRLDVLLRCERKTDGLVRVVDFLD